MANDPEGDPGSGKIPEETDPSLLRKVRAGENQAWQKLVAEYGPRVYGWCRAHGIGAEDSADLAQDIFLAVARSIDRFQRDGPGYAFRRWLRTLTNRRIIDFWRRQKRRAEPNAVGGSELHQQLEELFLPEPSSSPDRLPAEGQKKRLVQTLERIQARFRPTTWHAFWLVVVEGWPVEDVAEELKLTPGAVHLAKFRVLRVLREEMGHGDDQSSQE